MSDTSQINTMLSTTIAVIEYEVTIRRVRRVCELLGLFIHLILRSYDYNMLVGGLRVVNLCFVTLLSSERCSQFDRFHLQHVQIVNKPTFKKKCLAIMPRI